MTSVLLLLAGRRRPNRKPRGAGSDWPESKEPASFRVHIYIYNSITMIFVWCVRQGEAGVDGEAGLSGPDGAKVSLQIKLD